MSLPRLSSDRTPAAIRSASLMRHSRKSCGNGTRPDRPLINPGGPADAGLRRARMLRTTAHPVSAGSSDGVPINSERIFSRAPRGPAREPARSPPPGTRPQPACSPPGGPPACRPVLGGPCPPPPCFAVRVGSPSRASPAARRRTAGCTPGIFRIFSGHAPRTGSFCRWLSIA